MHRFRKSKIRQSEFCRLDRKETVVPSQARAQRRKRIFDQIRQFRSFSLRHVLIEKLYKIMKLKNDLNRFDNVLSFLIKLPLNINHLTETKIAINN